MFCISYFQFLVVLKKGQGDRSHPIICVRNKGTSGKQNIPHNSHRRHWYLALASRLANIPFKCYIHKHT